MCAARPTATDIARLLMMEVATGEDDEARIPLRRLPRNFPVRGSRRNGIWA